MIKRPYYRKVSGLITISLVMISVLALALYTKPAFSDTQLLVDPDFNASADTAALRANDTGQDWYESRGSFGSGDPTLLTLDTTNIAGDNTKKAALKSFGSSTTHNAYLTQEFSSWQSGTFSVSFDIYIDRIEVSGQHNATACIFIGSDNTTTNAPTGTSTERFVYFCFYDSTPGSSGNDIQIRANTANSPWADTSVFTLVASGLSYKTWIRIKIEVNVSGGSYNIYVDGTFKASVAKNSAYTSSSVYYMTFDADGDKRGDYYIDNVYSPAQDTQVKVVSTVPKTIVGQEFTVYINVTNVVDLYGWEFQFNYDPSILDLTYAENTSGGLNTPTNIFSSLTNETAGHLWWAVSTAYPTTTGINHANHAIFEIHFKGIAVGTSNLHLSGTILSNSTASQIAHTTLDSSVDIETLDLKVDAVEICNMYANETWTHSIYKDDTYTDLSPYYYPVNVTVENTGTLPAGSFYVKLEVYYDVTPEGSAELPVAGLTGSKTLELTFSGLFHPTSTGDAGRYSLKATVDSRGEVAEDNEANNVMEKKDFMVTVMGDVKGDKTVNILDGVKLAAAWSSTPIDARWNVAADLNHDNAVDISDGSRISLYWGETW